MRNRRHTDKTTPKRMQPLDDTERLHLGHVTKEVLRNYLYGTENQAFGDQRAVLNEGLLGEVPLPPQLRLGKSSIPQQSHGVFAMAWIKEGTKMGPFCGAVITVEDMNHGTHYPDVWEVFDNRGHVSHFVDGSSSPHSWITWVQCARSDQEQNLELIQHGDQLFYRARTDIFPGSELLVWYGHQHALFLGIPATTCSIQYSDKQANSSKRSGGANALPGLSSSKPCGTGGRGVGRYPCVLCRQGFNSRSNLRSHMRTHTLDKPFRCTFCGRTFSQSSTLRNHTRLHTGERPYKCNICKSAYSQLAGLRAHQKSSAHKPRPVSNSTAIDNSPLHQIGIYRNLVDKARIY